ncbi:MAG: hypothetical protein UT63_C0012G0015 [Candidatus Gottesmanbacteria bacterium GW2011_GWC2_39_8]|uniref:Uncharacterized protein n=1 Tax=Candidatus Gottesmanbacteria bacterium GW2011_GWC2_39_8 TaxID=1618450 RepID=A0A0G0Q8T9_9BACT|nr:MAG: hypothetical protein UT63_C0012G0015 [Candidatus Gottesmanbacteria bacterium GW2011_GWC2_39_8]
MSFENSEKKLFINKIMQACDYGGRRRRVQDLNLWTVIHRHGLASRSITALATLRI